MNWKVNGILFSLIRAEIFEEHIEEDVTDQLTPDLLIKLYELSKAHDMVHIAASALQKAGALGNDEISQKFLKAQMIAIFRCERLSYELEQLTQTLEEAGIPFMPLKGSVIRPLYPEAWMRTSCDIDVLVHESDLDAASTALVDKLGYTKDERSSHDVQMRSASGAHIELHYDLVEDGVASQASRVLANVWDHTALKEGASCHYLMSNEMFYFYHTAHMAKHFEHGGCGIKPFLDMCVLDRHFVCNAEKLREILSNGGLIKFYEAARSLTNVWFCGAEHTELTLDMHNYVLSGGVYGTLSNRVSAEQSKRGGKLGYALSRIFLSYDIIKFHYPVLQKHKWLLPVMQVRRWIKLIFKGGFKRGVNELKANNDVSKDKAAQMQSFLEKLGL